ncbi:DUF6088 family protein [Rhabdochlamydiaceae symbiont of Dictyostelium giganteum]|uniref:DUF6088 family protein n=1 Tax=Rhabdochlamydiaceae symbiont of Dictyostelium giganteum TaxID=3342349 RepID=UPI0038513EFC
MKKRTLKMRQSCKLLIKNRIIKHGPGWCFIVLHFSDLGSDVSIRKALSQLQKQCFIRRLTQGVYDYPIEHPLLGTIPPDLNAVAGVIAEKNGVQIQPCGAHAANLLGLSNQVPGKVIFLTEWPSRRVKIGNQEIIFKKTSKKMMLPAGTVEGLLIQALKNLGQYHIDEVSRAKVATLLKNSSESEIRKNMKFAPEWIRLFVFKVLELKP